MPAASNAAAIEVTPTRPSPATITTSESTWPIDEPVSSETPATTARISRRSAVVVM